MKKLVIAATLCLLATAAAAQRRKPCDLFGTVYFVKDKLDADFTVYLEETESFADLVVYREDNALYADQRGVWFVTDRLGLAHYRVYVENIKGRADFTIHYTETRSFAGCN